MTTTELYTEPTRRVGGWWIAAFGTAWLGVWMAQLVPVQELLPLQVAGVFGADPTNAHWQQDTLDFGIVSGIAAICSVIAYPLTGALSDRTTSRFGRRRPWIVIGALLFAAALVLLSFQSGLAGIVVCWALASIGFCALSAALTALISDQVPVGQRGLASALISAPQAIGLIIGVVLVLTLLTTQVAGYVGLAVLLLVLVTPFLLFVPDPRLPKEFRPPFTWASFVQGFWISPIKYPDFGWTLLSRVLVNIANALGTSLLLYVLAFGLKRDDPEDDLLVLIVIYTITSVVASLVCGRLSDRTGRRLPFVWASAVLQAVGAVLIAVFMGSADLGWTIALVAAALLGLGYGCFLSIDQALATQVLPDAASRGKDLGIMNIASVLPQGIAPMIGAVIVLAFGNFPALFIASAIVGVIGAVTVLPIRSVK